MRPALVTIVLILTTLRASSHQAPLCEQWAPAVAVGQLPVQLRESSGIAASRDYPGRLYHINDSGDAGRFYISNADGGGLQIVSIAGFRPRDTEALSLAPCAGASAGSCLYIGDIGDNQQRRATIEVVAVKEAAHFDTAVNALARLTLRYPDGPHNAESMAVHPDGTLYILTKERPARLFRARVDRPAQTLEAVMTVNTGTPPTDMAIADDGTRVVVLTYQSAVEWRMDFKEQRAIPLLSLPQQESATYLPGSRSIAFTTERAFAAQPQPVMRQDCRKPQ